MKTLRIGIVGAGRMGITHLAIINGDPRVEVSSVADNSGLVLDGLGRYLKCKTYKDAIKLIDDDRPDAVVVCTPPALHYEIVKAAMERRMHVFAEKPFTTSSRLAHELADGFEGAGLVNQVGYVNRFNDVFVRVKELLTEGVIGRVRRYRSEMFSRTVIRPHDGDGWRGSHKTGGGVTFEMASHAIDLVNFLLSKPDRIVGTVMNKVYSATVEDIVSSTFIHRDGGTGTLLVNWSDETVRKPTNKIELSGEHGKILADQHSVRIHLREANPKYELRDGWNTLYITDVFRSVPFYVRGNEYTRQLTHFVDNVSGARQVGHCTFRMAAQTLEVLEAMFADNQLTEETK